MTPNNATPWPVRGQLFNVGGTINNYANGNPISTGLTALAATISRDDAAPVATTNAPVEIGTNTGIFSLDLTAAETTCSKAVVIVSSSASGAMSRTLVVSTLNLADFVGRFDSQPVLRFEQMFKDLHAVFWNQYVMSGGTGTLYNKGAAVVKATFQFMQNLLNGSRGELD